MIAGLEGLPLGDLTPYQPHSETSREAARLISGEESETLRAQVYAAIVAAGPAGATDLELQRILNMDGSTERPRRVRLVELRLVKDSGRTRQTSKGRSATVWVAAWVAGRPLPNVTS